MNIQDYCFNKTITILRISLSRFQRNLKTYPTWVHLKSHLPKYCGISSGCNTTCDPAPNLLHVGSQPFSRHQKMTRQWPLGHCNWSICPPTLPTSKQGPFEAQQGEKSTAKDLLYGDRDLQWGLSVTSKWQNLPRHLMHMRIFVGEIWKKGIFFLLRELPGTKGNLCTRNSLGAEIMDFSSRLLNASENAWLEVEKKSRVLLGKSGD